MNTRPQIAQATILARFIGKEIGFEFTILWTQHPEMSELLVKKGAEKKFFASPKPHFPLSTTQVGEPGTFRDVRFEKTNQTTRLEDGQTYAAMIGLHVGEKIPFIVCLADYIKWKQDQNKAAKILEEREKKKSQPHANYLEEEFFRKPEEKKTRKGTYHNSPPVVVEHNPKIYHVDIGHEFIGTPTEIMNQACRAWGEDPTKALEEASWTVRTQNEDGTFSYLHCDCPTLPPVNKTMIEIGNRERRQLTPA